MQTLFCATITTALTLGARHHHPGCWKEPNLVQQPKLKFNKSKNHIKIRKIQENLGKN
ncbi:hypothetical protein Sjap_021907 [Stephania japonica]|uniref:Uncharacterized protein n=1 Tax=Stephania japonica TaxID=461633 RepID=A0AAP0EQG5_9MAGN